MARYATEFTGAFFLVLTIGLVTVQGVVPAPVAIGAALMVLVYMGGHISGAHYNPAISIAIMVRGKLDRRELVPYAMAQVAGAALAALVVAGLTGRFLVVAPASGTSAIVALLAELLYTFALALVILNVATSPRTEGNSYYGLAIGFTVMAGAFAVGGISGGVFNPAVGTGPILVALADGGSLGALWIYWVGPLAGALLAVPVYRLQHPTTGESERG